ncbi:hypothetical protein [Microbacterium arborescens]
MTLISTAEIPTLPADPDALSQSAQTLRQAVAGIPERSHDAVAAWRGITLSYETPDTPRLAASMTPVHDAGEDLAEAFGGMADAAESLADALAIARGRIRALESEMSALHRQVDAHRDGVTDLGADAGASDAWAPGQYEQNERLRDECGRIRRLIDDAVDECEQRLSRISSPPWHVTAGAIATGSAGAVTTAASATAQHARFADGIDMAILRRLSAHGGTQAAPLLALHPSWLDLLQDTPPDAERVREWWAATDPATRAALVAGVPLLVGNLDGVRLADRFAANERSMKTAVAEKEAQNARIRMQLDDPRTAPKDRVLLRQALAENQRHVDAWRAMLESEGSFLDEGGTRQRVEGTQLAVFDPSRDAIAVYYGLLDPATGDIPHWVEHVAVSVPGTGSNIADIGQQGWIISDATRTARTAVFQWVGGALPQDLSQAVDASYSHALAPRLAAFTNAIARPAGADLSMVGYSYGGATVGLAEAAGLEADKVVYVSAAGLGQGNETIADFPHTGDVPHYALMARNDAVVGLLQGPLPFVDLVHGPSTLTAPGVTRLETGRIDAADPDSPWLEAYNEPGNGQPPMVDSHSSVFMPDSTAMQNVAAVVTGGEAELFVPDEIIMTPDGPVSLPGYLIDGYQPRYVRIE